MKREINQRELRNNSGAVLRAVQAGETITVTNNGMPVAELSPLHRRRFVSAQRVIDTLAGAPEISLTDLRDDLDRLADPDPTPRG